MKLIPRRFILLAALGLMAVVATWCPSLLRAQAPWPFPPPTTPNAQRDALSGVQAQVGWLQNATRTAPNFRTGAYEMVWEQFQRLRGNYGALKLTLTPQQLANGANELAELDAGLDILQEAFGNYQEDLAAGRPAAAAFRTMCQVLGRAAGVWLQEFNRTCNSLGIGRVF